MAITGIVSKARFLANVSHNCHAKMLPSFINIKRNAWHDSNRRNKVTTDYDGEERVSFDATFGFERVSPDIKEEKVKEVFSNVAEKYDRMNDMMSMRVHRCWKKYFVEKKLNPMPGTQLIDVAGGTGDIAFRFLDHIKNLDKALVDENLQKSSVTVVDINPDMMDFGQKKASQLLYDDPGLIKWVQANATELPFPDNSFDAYTIAFGIRNVVNMEKALEEARRVLKPGGVFLCLEFSRVQNPLVAKFYDWYSFNVIPVMGKVVAGDWASYQYLIESIRQFPDQKDFAHMIQSAGFTMVEYENLSQGIAAIHSGYKPLG